MEFDPEAVRARRETMLLRLLFRATHAMNAELVKRLREKGHGDFQPSFTALLAHVDTEGIPVGEVARRMGVTRQAVSQLATAVERAGWLRRDAHPTDGRSVMLRHTPAGRAILMAALEAMEAIESDYAAQLGDETLDELKQDLERLLGAIDPQGALAPPAGR